LALLQFGNLPIVRITRRTLSLLAWTAAATGLYFLFGLVAAGSLVRLLGALGLVNEADRVVAADMVSAGFGPLLLGLAWVYRHAAGRENAGSMAAWLSGWALLLFGGVQVLGRFSPGLVPVLLLVLLVSWLARLGIIRYRRRSGRRR
jgi:hypothetical protein